MRILFVLPPTKTSNELDTLRSIPSAEIVTVGDPTHHSGVDIARSSRRLPVLGSPQRWTAALAWLTQLDKVDPGPVDMVMTTELFSPVSAQAARLAKQLQAPHVVLVQEILDGNPLYRLPPWRWYARRTTKSVDGVLCWISAGRRHVEHRGIAPDRVVVVAPGVDTEVFRPASERPASPTAIFLGELRPDKGITDVIAAADTVSARIGPAFRLLVVGDGPLRADVERAAASRPWLELRGRVRREEVPTTLRSASAFVLASFSRPFWVEQFGFAAVEAMACGLPVVATRCGAIPDVVPHHNPLVGEHDIAGLAEGLYRALGPEGAEWGRQNRDYACRQFDLTKQGVALGQELETLLARLPARHRPRIT